MTMGVADTRNRDEKRRLALDELDRAILAVLQEDARLSNEEVARRVASTEPTVRRRIRRMLDADVMRIVAVASPFDLGYRVMAILGIRLDRNHAREVGDALSAMNEVRFAGVTLGTFDVVAEVWLDDVDALLDFIPAKVSGLPGVRHVEPIQIVRLLKYSYDWGVQPSAELTLRPRA